MKIYIHFNLLIILEFFILFLILQHTHVSSESYNMDFVNVLSSFMKCSSIKKGERLRNKDSQLDSL